MLRGFISYGFDLSGTQLISRNSEKRNKLIQIFSSILIVKFLLAILAFSLICFLVLFIEKFHAHWEIFLLTSLLMFSDVIFPIWFFQGMEKMKLITYLRISYKGSFVIAILLLVHQKNDIWLVPLLDSLGAMLAGIIAIIIVKKNFNVYFKKQKYIYILFQLKYGWHIFLSKISVILYTSLNTFVLGILTNNESVGYYSLAEKVYMAIRGLYSPFIQALFPYLSKKFIKDKNLYFTLVKRISIGFFLSLIIVSFLVYGYSDKIIYLISGKQTIPSIEILQILSLAIIFSIGSLYSIFLIIKGEGKKLSKITFISMLLNTILIYPFIYLFNIYGLAYVFVTVQILQAILQFYHNKEIFFQGKI